ncbi:MAG: hypothetical protein ABID63_10465 [Pseudomonadota bacterium]
MFKTSDPYTFTFYGNIIDPTASKENQKIGLITILYEVAHYDNVQMATGTTNRGAATQNTREYILTCSQRATLFNNDGINLSPKTTITSYNNYPALLQSSIAISPADGQNVQILSFAPQTMNTQVQTSGTSGSSDGTNSTNSQSRTSGSSFSQTNSYSANAGITGDIFSFGASADHSSTSSTDNSATNSHDSGQSASQDNSATANMSIKDWGVYSYVNPSANSVTWAFAQEYPWDVLQCRSTTKSPNAPTGKTGLDVPASSLAALHAGNILLPPSHLSMFGLSFASQTQCKIIVGNSASNTATLKHRLYLYTATHSIDKTAVSVYMDSAPTELVTQDQSKIQVELDLAVMALDPIQQGGAPAIMGFIPNKFTTLPNAAGKTSKAFDIFSDSNNLRVTDTTNYASLATTAKTQGFSATPRALLAQIDSGCPKLSFCITFKIIDTVSDYTLYLKHWKLDDSGIQLEIVINGDKANALTKHVDALEAEGGENNLLAITLRNQNFSSVEYEDYLTPGLNTIEITISSPSGAAARYGLRAISIEPG